MSIWKGALRRRERLHRLGPPGYAPCTREWPHEGPCAHHLAPGRHGNLYVMPVGEVPEEVVMAMGGMPPSVAHQLEAEQLRKLRRENDEAERGSVPWALDPGDLATQGAAATFATLVYPGDDPLTISKREILEDDVFSGRARMVVTIA